MLWLCRSNWRFEMQKVFSWHYYGIYTQSPHIPFPYHSFPCFVYPPNHHAAVSATRPLQLRPKSVEQFAGSIRKAQLSYSSFRRLLKAFLFRQYDHCAL